MSILLNHTQMNGKLPPPLACAKRVCEVAGFSDLEVRVAGREAAAGEVRGRSSKGHKVYISWGPSAKIGSVQFDIKMDGLPVNLSNIISFGDSQSEGQWKRFAETIGNVILDNVVHENVGIPDSLMGSAIEDDPDVDIQAINTALNRLPAAGKNDGGTE